MQKENVSQSRSTFIKKTSLALVSVLGLGLAGFNFQKTQSFSDNALATLSNDEANDMIKKVSSSNNSKRLKPEPPPNTNQTPDGE